MSDQQEQRPVALKARARLSITQGVLKMLAACPQTFVADLCEQLMYENMVRMPDAELINTFKAMEAELERQNSSVKEETVVSQDEGPGLTTEAS